MHQKYVGKKSNTVNLEYMSENHQKKVKGGQTICVGKRLNWVKSNPSEMVKLDHLVLVIGGFYMHHIKTICKKSKPPINQIK